MSRRRAKKRFPGISVPLWLISFSDLMTLLLTFFVLLMSMSSMDSTTIARISGLSEGAAPLPRGGVGRLSDRVRLAVKMLREPESVVERNEQLKELLFPDNILPPEVNTGDPKENLRILAHPEGVVIVLTDGLLFAEGSTELDERGQKLIDALIPVIHGVNADINISGYTDSTELPPPGNEEISARRAMSVLERFLAGHVPADRFSVSGYGADKPMFDNTTAEGRRKNRRVEILLKTSKRQARYT